MSIENSAESYFRSQIKEICEDTGLAEHDAFPRWICENILDIPSSDISEAVSIGGKGDFGIDIFYVDDTGGRDEQYMCWAQVKYSKDLNRKIDRKEIDVFMATIGHLENCLPKSNIVFRKKSEEFIANGGIDAPIRKKMIFAVTGKLSPQAHERIKDKIWLNSKLSHNDGPDIDFQILDIDEILSYVTTPTTPSLKIKFNGPTIEKNDLETKKKSIMGYVDAKEIVMITKKYKGTMFLDNPRLSLGNTSTNKAIMKTLEKPELRKKFWKMNNGITAICDDYKEITSKFEYDIKNFKVVNGRQTTFSLEKYEKDHQQDNSLDDVSVFVTIHQAINAKERNLISQTTNTQNPIRPTDLISNLKELNDLEMDCNTKYPNFYFERQTKGFKSEDPNIKKRVTARRVLEKNNTARSYYAYKNDPSNAMMVSDTDLYSPTEQSYYKEIFHNRQIKELIIPHIFRNMLEALHDKWKKEALDDKWKKEALDDKWKKEALDNERKKKEKERKDRNSNIINKKIIKYYILHFINLSMLSINMNNRTIIENELIRIFNNLDKKDKLPDMFLEIAEISFNNFMTYFDTNKRETWPEKYHNKPKALDDKPTSFEIMNQLKKGGQDIKIHLLSMREEWLKQTGSDRLQEKLLKLIPNSN